MPKPPLLPRATPDHVQFDPAGVWHFLDAIERRGIELHSLMLLRHGQVFAEGWWQPYGPDDTPLLYSLSKTFTSAAVGLAVSSGALSYDDLLVDLFADVVTDAGPVASRIRVRDCLAMATGHTADVVPTPRLASRPGREPWRVTLAIEPQGTPGETFCYNQWSTWTLAEAVRHATGSDVLALLNERVFGPMGITDAAWDRDSGGRVLGYSGLHLRTEAVAAFFALLAAGGVHEGRLLLPSEWIEQYARPHSATAGPGMTADWAAGYGWQVWRNAEFGHRGDGAFGQFGIVLPEVDAVIVATAGTDRMQEVLDDVWTHLLPAFDRPAEQGADAVASRLAGLRMAPVGGERGGSVALTFENRNNRWRLVDDPDGWRLRWVDAQGGDNTLVVGHGTWHRSVMRWQGRELPVAASGGWVGWGHWVGHVVTLGSPHAVVVHLRDDGSGRAEWVIPPLAAEALAGLAMPIARPSGT